MRRDMVRRCTLAEERRTLVAERVGAEHEADDDRVGRPDSATLPGRLVREYVVMARLAPRRQRFEQIDGRHPHLAVGFDRREQ